MNLTTDEAKYVAGVFDHGLRVRLRKRGGICVSVNSSSMELLTWLQKKCGGSIGLNHGESYRWSIYNKRSVGTLMALVGPHMIVKKKGAAALDRYCFSSDPADRQRVFDALGRPG